MSAPTHSPPRVRDLLVLAALAALYFGAGLGARDLWNPNEGTYGRAVVEMAEAGEWLVPTLNDEVFAEKPILYYWGALAGAKLFGGVSEFTLRLPALLAGIGSALVLYLLVHGYLGRRRAWLAVMLFAIQYLVWWTARAVQMDNLVLFSTLIVVYALSGGLDRQWSPLRSWVVAGFGAGLGFSAKGPVALLLPALVLVAYCAVSKRWPASLLRWRAIGVGLLAFAAFGLPWYAFLLASGRYDFLYEMLIRQNFSRFVEAWDHIQPWWYYLEYVWVDYAPASLLLPFAAFLKPESSREAAAHRLAWVWIVAIVFFFSLADSKRAPYILPVAPAVAILAAGVVDRFLAGRLSRHLYRGALAVHAFLGLVFLSGGIYLFAVPSQPELPASLSPSRVATMLTTLGLAILVTCFWSRWRSKAPFALAASMMALCLLAALWILPALDVLKSHRAFANELGAFLGPDRPIAARFGGYKWVRGGYPYYLGRSIPHLDTEAEVERYWSETRSPCLLMEDRHFERWHDRLPGAEVILEQRIGSETAHVLCRD